MSTSLTGKVALVTGAASGIGQAAAIAIAEAGAQAVALVDLAEERSQETAAAVRERGAEALLIAADVSKFADVEAMVQKTVDAFGRLDCAFNNAGIGPAHALPAADMSEADWNRVISINLTGVWLCMKAEIPAMLKAGGGSIVNCSSVLGLVGFANSASYVAAKHGVVGLTKAAAMDYGTAGIRVNAICPGFIRTPLLAGTIEGHEEVEQFLVQSHPIGRLGESEEVAALAAWLCSDAASFMTGAAIPVDGGYVAR